MLSRDNNESHDANHSRGHQIHEIAGPEQIDIDEDIENGRF